MCLKLSNLVCGIAKIVTVEQKKIMNAELWNCDCEQAYLKKLQNCNCGLVQVGIAKLR